MNEREQYETQRDYSLHAENNSKATSFTSPMMNYASSIVTLTNPDSEVYKMELAFRGMILDKEGNPKPVAKPLMNEEGIQRIVGIVQSFVAQNSVWSNLDKHDVPNLMEFLYDTIARDLMMNEKKYEVLDSTSRDKIFFTSLSTAFMTLKRAYEEGEKRFWKGSQQEITTRVEGTKANKGILSSIIGWAK